MVSSAEKNLMPGLHRLKKEGSRSAKQTMTYFARMTALGH